jgi:uncharacterized membrane protein YGL010W
MRWALTNIILVLLRENYVAQIISFLIISVVAQALIMRAQPFDCALENRMNLLIEISVSLYLYAQLALTDFMGENTLRDSLGWFLACLIITVVAVNLLVLCFKVLASVFKLARKLLIKYKKSDTERTVAIKPEGKPSQPTFEKLPQIPL